MTCHIEICQERLHLLPEKLVWWPTRQTLLVADTHFGKAATFRQAGIPVPTGTTRVMLERIGRSVQRFEARHLVFLGDFVHSATRCETGFEAELVSWRSRHADLQLTLIKGNHDRGHGNLFERMGLQVVSEPFEMAPFSLCHNHEANEEGPRYTLAGHVHPGICLQDIGSRIKLPCFYFGQQHALLPAFGEFTGLATIRQEADDRVFAVLENEVIDMSAPAGSAETPANAATPDQ